MCKIRTITYSCNHTVSFRLSICHGSFTIISKSGRTPKPACSSSASLTFRSSSKCGPCQKEPAAEELNAAIAAVRARWDVSPDDTIIAETEHEFRCWQLEKAYPMPKREKSLRPEKGLESTPSKGQSKLRLEVRPDEVVICGKWGEWPEGAEYEDLGVEIARAEAEKEAQLAGPDPEEFVPAGDNGWPASFDEVDFEFDWPKDDLQDVDGEVKGGHGESSYAASFNSVDTESTDSADEAREQDQEVEVASFEHFDQEIKQKSGEVTMEQTKVDHPQIWQRGASNKPCALSQDTAKPKLEQSDWWRCSWSTWITVSP